MTSPARLRSRRSALVLALFALFLSSLVQLAVPSSVGAADGEVIQRGTNVCTDITKSASNSAGFTCTNLGDCPANISGCYVEIKVQTQCEWAWCTTYDDRTGWIRLGVGQDSFGYCVHGKQRWQALLRIAWVDNTTTTVETWGEPEYRASVSGAVNTRIAKFLYEGEGRSGFKYGTRISTKVGTSGSAGETIVASSGGTWITLSC